MTPALASPAPSQAQSLPPVHEVAPEAIREVPLGAVVFRASIKAVDASWISVCSDGQERFQKMLAAGDTRELEFSKLALVRLGNGPAVEVTMDGKSIQPSGPPGVVRAIELSPGGVRFVNYRDNSPACGKDTGLTYPAESTVAARR
jgi:hypothetical protein